MFVVPVLLALISFDMKKERVNKIVFIYIFFLIMLGGLRGDFTTDYRHYVSWYEYVRDVNFSSLLDVWGEPGFVFLNWLCSRFFSDAVPFFVVCMSIILLPVYYLSCKCKNSFLFVLLYLSFGIMFSSYNVMREVMAASLFLYTFTYIKNGSCLKYILFVLLISTIHKSCLILLPFYYILRLKSSAKSILLFLVVVGICFLKLDYIMDLFDSLLYGGKFASRLIGNIGSITIQAFVVPFLFILVVLFTFFTDENQTSLSETRMNENNIIINSALVSLGFFLFAQKIPILVRFTYFFFPFVFYGFVNNLMRFPKEKKVFFVWGTVCFCFLYYFIFGQYYNVFYFYWQNQTL